MALHKEQPRKTYLQFRGFRICEVFKDPVEGSKPDITYHPQTREPITKHVIPYNCVDGYIDKIEWYSREHQGLQYQGHKVHISDPSDGMQAVLDFPFNTGVWDSFAKAIGNVDFTQMVSFSAWKGHNQAGKDTTAFCMRQPDKDGPIVRRLYTRENPNGMPDGVQNPRTKKWDFSAQQGWLCDQIDELAPLIEQCAVNRAANPPAQRQPQHDSDDGPNLGEPPADWDDYDFEEAVAQREEDAAFDLQDVRWACGEVLRAAWVSTLQQAADAGLPTSKLVADMAREHKESVAHRWTAAQMQTSISYLQHQMDTAAGASNTSSVPAPDEADVNNRINQALSLLTDGTAAQIGKLTANLMGHRHPVMPAELALDERVNLLARLRAKYERERGAAQRAA